MEITIVLVLLLLAIIAFSTEKISVDVVAMICVITLVLTGIIDAKEAFAPFGSDFLIMLASIFIVTGAIDQSGILEAMSTKLLREGKTGRRRLMLPIMFVTSIFSAFMNNTTVTALMVNPVMAVARRANISFSKVLMPVAFASIVGGTCTLIGTSTNVAVNAYLEKNGYPTLGMFDFVILGVIMVILTIVFFALIGHRLLPKRGSEENVNNYGVRSYLSEIVIRHNSSLIGQVVHESDLSKMGFEVLGIIRDKRQFAPGPNMNFSDGDLVLVKGDVKNLVNVKNAKGIDIMADALSFYDQGVDLLKLKEVVIAGRSDLAGKTIGEIDFRRRYGMLVVAINREGQHIVNAIKDYSLEVGDMLLVQGSEDSFNNLGSHHDMVVLGEHTAPVRNLKKGYLTIGLFLVAIILASFSIIPTGIAFLSAAVLAMLTKSIRPEDAYNNIEWRLLVLIAGMTAFGTAMTNSGADKYLAEIVVDIFQIVVVQKKDQFRLKKLISNSLKNHVRLRGYFRIRKQPDVVLIRLKYLNALSHLQSSFELMYHIRVYIIYYIIVMQPLLHKHLTAKPCLHTNLNKV